MEKLYSNCLVGKLFFRIHCVRRCRAGTGQYEYASGVRTSPTLLLQCSQTTKSNVIDSNQFAMIFVVIQEENRTKDSYDDNLPSVLVAGGGVCQLWRRRLLVSPSVFGVSENVTVLECLRCFLRDLVGTNWQYVLQNASELANSIVLFCRSRIRYSCCSKYVAFGVLKKMALHKREEASDRRSLLVCHFFELM